MCKCEEIYKGDRVLQRGGKIMSKKVLAFLLTLCLVIGCVPTLTFAVNTIGKNVLTVKKIGDSGKYQAILTVDKDYTNGKAGSLQIGFTFDEGVFSVTGSSLKIGDTECSGTDIRITDGINADGNGEITAAISTGATSGGDVDITGDIQLIVNMELKTGKNVSDIEKVFKVSSYELYETVSGKQALVVGTAGNNPSQYALDVGTNGTVAVQNIINAEGSHVINGNVLSTYDIAIIYASEVVYTYIPEDAEVSDSEFRNAEQQYDTDRNIKGKWCGYGDGSGFDGNQNRITVINGTTVESKITATAEKDSKMSDSFEIDVKSIDQAKGDDYAALSKVCSTSFETSDIEKAFAVCKVAGKRFGDKGNADIAIDAKTNDSISYVNLYYNLTGNPGKDVTKYVSGGGNAASTKLGTITIKVKAA